MHVCMFKHVLDTVIQLGCDMNVAMDVGVITCGPQI